MDFSDKTLVLCLGAQKAGTSWLAAYLRSHPDVFIPRMKELHWFDVVHRPDPYRRFEATIFNRMQDLIAGTKWAAKDRAERLEEAGQQIERLSMKDDADYMAFFRNRVTTHTVFGDFSPSYSVLDEEALRHMAGMHPKVRFIFLMRNPVDRFWSALRDREKAVPGFNALTSFEAMLDDPLFAERNDYASAVAKFDAVLPEGAVHYEFYEELFSRDAVNRICEFLGIDSWGGDFRARVNESPVLSLTDESRDVAVRRLLPVYEAMAERFPIPSAWRLDMARLESQDRHARRVAAASPS